jgi:hypothetical protein
MTSEVRFRAELPVYGVERLELATAQRALKTRVRNGVDTRLRILQYTNGSVIRFRARLSEGRTPRLEVTRS